MGSICYAGSSSGATKYKNQDNFIVNDIFKGFDTAYFCGTCDMVAQNQWNIAAVADGVTNSFDGGLCADICVETLQESFRCSSFADKKEPEEIESVIMQTLEGARKKMQTALEEKGTFSEGATTVSLVLFNDTEIYHYNIGDSPIKLLRNGEFVELSENQSEGVRLTEYLGSCTIGNGHFGKTHFGKGDILYLSTDGIGKVISEESEKEILRSDDPVVSLLELSLKNKCNDNVTAIVIKHENG